jgi:2-polyprenyl-6-methoxyphenol hydroxylase-like FAD-dependent oxidoreductase
MPLRKVLIVGAGPAGMVAAIALKRRGVDVELVEIEPDHAAVGIGVNLQNSPLRALDSLGLLDEIENRGYPTNVVNMLSAGGHPIMPPLRPASLVPGRPAAIAIGRGVLSSILADAVDAEGIRTHFGVTVETLANNQDVVDVTLTDGSTGTYDLLIGADGINSRVRGLAFGADAPTPEYSGRSIWRAGAARGEVAEYELFNGQVSKVGLVPISDDRMYVYALEILAEELHRRDPEDLDDGMKRALAPFGGHVTGVALRLDPGAELRALRILMMPDPWYRGRVLLIGDAAHASTPHISYGLGIAIEDGIVLAELAGQRDVDVDDMLAEFMKRRFERCRMVVENSRQLGSWEQDPPEDRSAYGALMARSLEELSQPI